MQMFFSKSKNVFEPGANRSKDNKKPNTGRVIIFKTRKKQ